MIRILIVDDSPIVRSIFSRELGKIEGFEVVGAAPDAFAARDMIVDQKPDVVLLDLEMPRMDGLTFLKKLMEHHPLPVIIISALTQPGTALALEALAQGAVEVLCKPTSEGAMRGLIGELRTKIGAAVRAGARAAHAREHVWDRPLARAQCGAGRIIAMGASTGGVTALGRVLPRFPENSPPIMIVQHMPPGFTKALAERLNRECAGLEVTEATNGEILCPGKAVIAPGDKHLLVRATPGGYVAEVKCGPRVNLHRPSVDVLFKSVAAVAGSKAVGVIMTGMGDDGADGLVAMRAAGAATIAQHEATCVVYGMPKEAVARGGADEIALLDSIAERTLARACELRR
jgi:two-component system chemotaxis response regulator CheB